MADVRTITVVLALLALFVDVLGFALPYWRKYRTLGGSQNDGLWQICGRGGCVNMSSNQAFFVATQVFECFGLILGALCTFFIVCFTFVNQFKANYNFRQGGKWCALGAAIAIAIGVIIFGAQLQYFLHAAYGLTCCAAILYFIVFILQVAVRTNL